MQPGTGSPSSAPEAITVASIDSNWQRSTFSDYGPEVDIFAPGRGVKSAWPTGDNAYGLLTGTSHAAPHVAGVALYLLALEGGAVAPALAQEMQERYSELLKGIAYTFAIAYCYASFRPELLLTRA